LQINCQLKTALVAAASRLQYHEKKYTGASGFGVGLDIVGEEEKILAHGGRYEQAENL